MTPDKPISRPKDDPHYAPESGEKPEPEAPDASGQRRTVEQQQPPAPPQRRKRDPEGSEAPQDNVSHAPEGGDKLEGGPLGR
ncbi:hypothetical protein HLB44_32755 [Aquincola sp. S2]|uniref:Uncharacterized protein n=1 Tax=Pseudaquabacterium terrae TaxID=2732868 RepID=A0ABX2ET12_9BURK|nr:hypothetical protein [Aquabacterium terrae]NRF71766.1 hypothetical protein [Aquabacterium terrae]